MSILDKAKAAAERARDQARQGAEQGRARLMEMRARRQRGRLVRQLGEACYGEHSGQGKHEPVASALAALDAHAQAHPRAPDLARHLDEHRLAEFVEKIYTAA
jgi:hypothetical protein